MSAILLDDDLVAAISQAVHQRALQFPQSVAADILPLHFQEVIQGVAASIDLEFPDHDAALWAALGRWKASNPKHFTRRRSNPSRISMSHFFAKKTA